MVELTKFSLISACLVLRAAASRRSNMDPSWSPPRETSEAELMAKSSNGVSPVPTSRPELAGMELFRRGDYSLPSDWCGWYADYKSNTFTCDKVGASCINFGTLRGCCSGSSDSCSSTIWSDCIPASSLPSSTSCAAGTTCCSDSEFPNCGTVFMSSSTNPDTTYTMIQCWEARFESTYRMQDYPPIISSTAASTAPAPVTSPDTETTPATSPSPSPTPVPLGSGGSSSSTPVGAIVGGVVGGVAVIGLIALGIVFLMRKKKHPNHGSPTTTQYSQVPPAAGYPTAPYPQAPYSPGPQFDPAFKGHYAPGVGMSPGAPNYSSPAPGWADPNVYQKVDGLTPPPVSQHTMQPVMAHEMPAVQAMGTGGNRAELG